MSLFHHLSERQLMELIMVDLTKLTADVAALDTKVDAVLAALGTARNDPVAQAAVDAAATSVEAVNTKLDAALAAGASGPSGASGPTAGASGASGTAVGAS